VAQDLICFYGNDVSPLTSSKLLFLFVLSGGSNHLRGFSTMEKVWKVMHEIITCKNCGKAMSIELSKFQHQSDVRGTCRHCGKINYCEQRFFKIIQQFLIRPKYVGDLEWNLTQNC
jgi:hypothetical protein